MKRIVVAFFLAFIGLSLASFCPNVVAQDYSLAVDRELCDDSERFDESFDASTGAFTVSVLTRIISQGDEPGNGDQLGMIWNVGSGWNDGTRVYYDWRTRRFTFQIGREQGAAGVTTGRSYAYGVLREITATYDDATKLASLYIDGELAASGELECELNCPEKPLNVGFGGFGVGSNRMYVERVDVWNSALDAETIAERNASRAGAERAMARTLDLMESSPNAIPVLDSFKDAETLLSFNLPEGERARAQETALWNQLRSNQVQYSRTNLQTSDYDTVAAIVFARANALLTLDADRTEGPVTTEELKEYGQNLFFLKSLQKLTAANLAAAKKLGSSTSFDAQRNRKFMTENRAVIAKFTEKNAECARLMRELAQAYPRQASAFAKIDKFDVQVDRIRRLERDALAVYTELCASHVAQKYTRFIYVSVDGSDKSGTGSKDAPYASLARAFDDVMTRRAGGDNMKVVIELSEGEYQVERTARLADCDRVQVRAAEGANVVLTGARRVKNFQSLAELCEDNSKLKEQYERLAPEAREHVLLADLTACGVTDFGRLQRRGYGMSDKVAPIPSLYLNGVGQNVARWPNPDEKPLTFGDVAQPASEKSQAGDDLASGSTFLSDRERIASWSLNGDGSSDDIWAFGLYQWEWAANLRRVLAFDTKTGAVTFDYPDGSGKYTYYFVNVFEELDQPGEYYVDAKEGLLYFYPPEELATPEAINDATVEYDQFDQRFIELEGTTDVLLRGLTLRGGRESAMAMLNCKRCFFSDGTIEQFGGNAAIINDGSFCGVLNSRLRELGACGVRIQGGDRATLADCRHILSNNYISQFSRIDRVYAPALHATGCGIVATNNLICDSPHHAMRTDGNDIYVARNEIHSVVYEYSDQSGIDVFCDPTYRGIVIEHNLWRHIGSSFALCGQAGIRLDDSISGVVMRDNLFYRCSNGAFGGIQIHGGKDNYATGNVFIDCKYAFSFTPWGAGRYETFAKERFPKNLESEMYRHDYPFFDEIFEHENRNYIFDNYAINCEALNRSGDSENVFIGNHERTLAQDDKGVTERDGEFLTDVRALKSWLEQASGMSLREVGLRSNWADANEPVVEQYVRQFSE